MLNKVVPTLTRFSQHSVIDNRRRNQEDNLTPTSRIIVPTERLTDHRDIPQQWHLTTRCSRGLRKQTTEHYSLTVTDHHIRGHLSRIFVRDCHSRTGRVGRAPKVKARNLRAKLQADQAILRHKRANRKLGTNLEELNSLSRRGLRAHGIEVTNTSTNQHACRLTIQGQDLWV